MRTRAKGNVLDAVSYPMGGITLDGGSAVVGGTNTGPGGNDAIIINGDFSYLFTASRAFTIVGGPNAGSYVVIAPGAALNGATTEIPVAAITSLLAGGNILGFGIDLNQTVITNGAEPVISTDLATKNYVDTTPASSLAPGVYGIDISGTAADADLLDGIDSTGFFKINVNNTSDSSITLQSATSKFLVFNDTAGNNDPGIHMQTGGAVNAGAIIDNVNSQANGYLRLWRYNAGGGMAAQIRLFEDGNIIIDPSGTTTNDGNFNVTGTIVASLDITAFSDIRLKEDIRSIDNAMDRISKIGGYTFTRNDIDDDNERHVGVIAQEIQKVLPEAVTTNDDGMLSVAYGNLVALLIEGMKEQKNEIDDLRKRLDDLEE